MADKTRDLSPEKLLLLQRRLRGFAGKPAQERALEPRAPSSPALLSFAQHQMWLIDRMTPGCPAYNLPVAYRLNGSLQSGALEAAFNEVIKRHEILRTHFTAQDGEPIQVVHPPWELELTLAELDQLPAGQRQAALRERLLAESVRPFDLTTLPLLRVLLFKLADREHVLFINFHHIIADGLSIALLLKEVDACYRAIGSGRQPTLPALTVQYSDFAAWERQRAAASDRETQLAFWKDQLSGDLPVLDLPWDKPRPTTQSFKGSNVFLNLPAPLSAQLQALAAAQGATFFMAILAAFYALLHRYSGARDIIVGAPVANRTRKEVQPLMGNFLNILALKCDLSGDPSFNQLLHTARDVVLSAFSHQEVPFEHVVEGLHVQRDPSRNPIFQAMLQVLPRGEARLAELEINEFQFDPGFAQFDLSLHLYETGDGYKGRFEYCSDLFNHDTVQRFADHFLQLLRQLTAKPEMRISSIPILTPAERDRLLSQWNCTARDYPRQLCLPQLFESQAERTPEAVAVVSGDRQLTYRELNRSANQLASHLRKLGVGPDTLVGICVERSLEMVIALLGVLKAGGAYVPLDPKYPQERLAFVIENARMPVLLTQADLLGNLPQPPARTLCLDRDWGSIQTERGENLSTIAKPEHLAYVIYTSGSTGRPKGVQISHEALVNLLSSMSREPGLDSADILLAVTTLSFDIAGLELWLPLMVGARVVIAGTDVAMDGRRLAELLAQSRANVMQATPATWRMLLEQGWPGSPGLKILCGGEAWSEDLARELLPRCASLWNMYGPTETTIWSAVSKVEASERPLIGRPIANTCFYVLDAHLQPVPVGVPGELHIGGAGLARGYFNQGDLTAEKFIADPFSTEPGARIYKTGDLVRYRPDGAIKFLGRMDNQVKLRGHRIELGEIESLLRQCPGVRECVATVREDVPGDKQLVAYLVVEGETKPKTGEFRNLLKQKLPEYMVPSAFVKLQALPLTPNGKIDRKSLPVPDSSQARPGKSYVGPRTPAEKMLAEIWSEILRLKQVGIHDNFFELGGHSLLAVRVQVRVEKEFGRRLPLAAFFRSPTVAELAKLLNDPGALARLTGVLTLQSQGDRPPVFCLHSLGLSQRLARHLGPGRTVHGVVSPVDVELRLWHKTHRLEISVEELAARYVTEIQRVQPSGPYNLLGLCLGGVLAFEAARQLTRSGETVASVILLDSFYYLGRKTWLRRWLNRSTFHARKLYEHGGGYLLVKLREKGHRQKRHLSQRRAEEKDLRDAFHGQIVTAFDVELVKRYVAQPYSGRVVLFRAVTELHPFRFDFGETNGWEEVLSGELHTERIQTDHMGIGLEPSVGLVARKVEQYLSRAESQFADRILNRHTLVDAAHFLSNEARG